MKSRQVWLAFWSTRVGLFLWGWWCCATYPWTGSDWHAFPQWPWLDGWMRYDSGWLMSITTQGHQLVPGAQCNAAFLPLYPALSWLVGRPFRSLFTDPNTATAVAGFFLSYLGLLLGLIGLHRLMRLRSTPPAADRAVWWLALFPYAYFYGAFYTEGVYLALVVWAFVGLEEERDTAACALAALAILCRLQGAFVALGLGVEILRRRRRPLALLLLPAAVALLLAYYTVTTGHPLAFVLAQRTWRELPMWTAFEWMPQAPLFQQLVWGGNTVCLVLALLGAVACTRRWGAGYGVLVVLSMLVPAASSIGSLGRYACSLFPLFMVAGERLPRGCYLLQIPALLYYSRLFFTWRPAF